MHAAATPVVRTAYWIGRIKPGSEQAFRERIDGGLIATMRRVPGVARAWALWPEKREASPPDIVCQIVLEFASPADLERMLQASERREAQAHGHAAAQWFEGAISHIEGVTSLL